MAKASVANVPAEQPIEGSLSDADPPSNDESLSPLSNESLLDAELPSNDEISPSLFDHEVLPDAEQLVEESLFDHEFHLGTELPSNAKSPSKKASSLPHKDTTEYYINSLTWRLMQMSQAPGRLRSIYCSWTKESFKRLVQTRGLISLQRLGKLFIQPLHLRWISFVLLMLMQAMRKIGESILS
jgi:hypothetical protein